MIISINVNGFCGNCNKCNPKNKDNKCFETRKSYIEKIKTFINVNNENDLAILQEIPCEDKLYNFLEEKFNNFEILKPNHLEKHAKQCTIAIFSKRSKWVRTEERLEYTKDEKGRFNYGNKFVELQCGDSTLLGVHMPPDDKMWELLLQTLKNTPYTYVIGDFNANEKRGKMYDKPEKLRNCGYNHLIPNNIITCYSRQTSIDNMYIKSDFTINKNFAVKVLDTHFTDHALCILEYDSEFLS